MDSNKCVLEVTNVISLPGVGVRSVKYIAKYIEFWSDCGSESYDVCF